MHTKRITAPLYWKIERKAFFWAYTPQGAHPKFQSIPLGVVIRDILGLVDNNKESSIVLQKKLVKVDNVVRKSATFGAGLMDSITINDKSYRVIPKLSGLQLIEIPITEAAKKLVKIVNKTNYNGNIQLNLHDGRCLIASEKKYRVGDSLLISLPDQKVIKHLPLKEGVEVLIISGKHSGSLAKYLGSRRVSLRDVSALIQIDGDQYETRIDYLMPVGDLKVSA